MSNLLLRASRANTHITTDFPNKSISRNQEQAGNSTTVLRKHCSMYLVCYYSKYLALTKPDSFYARCIHLCSVTSQDK